MKKLCAVLFALLAACGGALEIVDTPPIADMYADAYKKIDEKNYEEAANAFVEIEASYPAGAWAADALVMAAYAQYETGKFADAIGTIDRFMRFHPGNKNAAYMLYLRGMCFYRQVSDVRREPGMSQYALAAFMTLTQRFPDSEYAKNAANKIVILKNYIAGKMMYSARREMSRENWPSAITDLQKIITQMPETQMAAEAMFRLNESYRALGLDDQAAGWAAMLRKNFPDSDWSKKL
ncbi:MAG: outer membrane protein assembly factor BamD [Rickettsiales bacterium]|jgi:outer membrane protein assembly factor BamD|nr:outer membrane protein assembly factor BamD [Rickettsiales bacterium]